MGEDEMIHRQEFHELKDEVNLMKLDQQKQIWEHKALEKFVGAMHTDQVNQQRTLDRIDKTLSQIKWMIFGIIGFVAILRLYAVGDFKSILITLAQLVN